MKTSPENILLNMGDLKLSEKFFLISGSEETLIKSVEKKIINHFKERGFNEIIKTEGLKLTELTKDGDEQSLFCNSKIIIHKNPKEVDFEYFKKNNEQTVVIITHTNLKGSSKLKKNFDHLENFNSIGCYQMTGVFKKKVADVFFNKNKIKIDKEGYWYLIDRGPNVYGLFEKELEKLINYGEKDLTLKDVRLLLSNNTKSDDFDFLIFLILSNKPAIIKKMKDVVHGPGDAYILIQRIKFYVDLLISIETYPQIEIIFPRYLFMHKASFQKMFKKINHEKIIKIIKSMKKTELMLRKNNELYFLICQRFLLNLNNIAK